MGPARRYLIDASMAQAGGGFTYVVNLLPELLRVAPRDRFRLLVRNERLARSLPAADNLEMTELPQAGFGRRLSFLLAGAPRIAAEWRADLYFSAAESTPLRLHCPLVASFRNPNIVDRRGHGWPPYQRTRLELLHGLAKFVARRCDKVLFVSHDSARWMGDDLALPAEKRRVIHHGIDLAAWRESVAGPRPERPYVLSVGTTYRYKNYLRLIEAWVLLAERMAEVPDLVIIGDDVDPPNLARMHEARAATGSLAERIRILGDVPYAEVRRWYAGASLFVFPSYLETFGHPLLEAMASGLPLVASDIPVFREVAGEAALFVDPFDAQAICDGVHRVLTSADTREALLARGRERVREFPWSRSAEQHLALFREVLGD